MKESIPVKMQVDLISIRHGWSQEKVHSNVWRYCRGPVSLEVAYTTGGHFGLHTIHVETPSASYWIHNKERNKRQRLLDLLEEGT